MKHFRSFFICFLLIQGIFKFSALANDDKKIAFAFSGAGGRLSQHLALMEALVKGLTPSGEKIRPDILSGASSGSISSVALNMIMRNEDLNLTGFSWDDYKELVFNLQTSDVYDDSWEGIAKIMTYNIFQGYFLDNTPLRNYLAPYVTKWNISKFGDLYLPTAISLVNQTSGDSFRLWSTDPRYADLDILDVIMASAALPIAFPPRQVAGLGDTIWIDGGTGIDTLPVYAPLHEADVDELYIICYGSALTSGGGLDLPWYLQDIPIVKNSMAVIEDMRVDLFNGGIDMAQRSNVTSFLYIPSLNQTFSALDFDDEKYEYAVTMEWAIANDPSQLNNIH